MSAKRIILCGGTAAPKPKDPNADVLPLRVGSKRSATNDVVLQIEHLPDRFLKSVPKPFEDLLEIATYVYCADQATSRGKMDVDTFGGKWRRHFEFHIPVRVPELWNSDSAKSTLRATLEFLSDDQFDFVFYPAKHAQPAERYFQTSLFPPEFKDRPEGVVLFSGGLDSLSGAVEDAVNQKRRVMLVNHRPTPKLNNVHRRLEELLAQKAQSFRPTHLHVTINKTKELNREYTQRTRSFLYAALGATVARMLDLRNVRFYENGVVSMNLPVCAQVVGSRATRTTHPRTLVNYQKLLSIVAGEAFRVDNPFIWETKGEVIGRIAKANCGELINASVSCAHTWESSIQHTHCGTCSQCIDRRFGIVAAEAEVFDDAAHYASDVFTGARSKDEDRMMVATYLERANKIATLRDATELLSRFPEVARLLPHLSSNALAAAQRVFDLHKRHAAEVTTAVEEMFARHKSEVRQGTLPSNCLLRIAYESGPRHAKAVDSTAAKQEQEARWEKEKEDANTYRLSKGYKVWGLVFAGKEVPLADERGLELIEYLLKNPPEEPIHASNLEHLADGAVVLDEFAAVDAGAVHATLSGPVQEATGKKLGGGVGTLLTKKLSTLRSAIDDVTLPESERRQAQEELDELVEQTKKGGKVATAAGRASERVRKAIRRFIDDVKKEKGRDKRPNPVLHAFAEHLEKHLWTPSMSQKARAGRPGCFIYEPPAGVVWRD